MWPGFRRVISGAWRGVMPSSPSSPVATTITASPWKISASALTMSQRMVLITLSLRPTYRTERMRFCRRHPVLGDAGSNGRSGGLLGAHLFGLLDGLVDAADHVERLLRDVVHVAVDDHLEAAD